ncbi:MAG: PDZ domain-containing protein [Lachnospiraceae bacterium]|nr:PDZ domain-containing protein [Lachnospiraceae bacterium]
MPDRQESNHDNFMIEKIKQRPINKRRLIRRTVITASMAVIFGLIACFTFLVLEPVISNWLYPEEEPEAIIFPEEPEEMLPEEMLEEYLQPSPSPSPSPGPEEQEEPERVELDEQQIQEILDKVVLDMGDYRQLYSVLSDYVKQVSQYMVVVTGTKSDTDWFANVYESKNETSGVVIGNNGKELLILTDYNSVKRADHLTVTFSNGVQADALMMQCYQDGNLVVLCVSLNVLSQEMQAEDMHIAPLGSSLQRNLVGSPVIAVGNPMGTSGSVGYGVITAAGSQVTLADMNFQLLTTDIYGSQSAGGVLFNTSGQVVGFIITGKTGSDMRNIISAYGISDLKQMISRLTKGDRIPYLGIIGADVPKEANEQSQVPFGAYVREVEMDSPAMLAGIQSGDVIVGIDQQSVTKMSDYSSYLLKINPEDVLTVRVMRQSQGEYKEIAFEVTVGEAD